MKKVKDDDPKNMDKKRLRYIFKRVIKRIKEKPNGFFKFKKMRGFCGLLHWDECIEIDHRKDIVPTIIHEVLHDLYENNSETWIRQVESKISQILEPNDIHSLMVNFFEKMEITKSKK